MTKVTYWGDIIVATNSSFSSSCLDFSFLCALGWALFSQSIIIQHILRCRVPRPLSPTSAITIALEKTWIESNWCLCCFEETLFFFFFWHRPKVLILQSSLPLNCTVPLNCTTELYYHWTVLKFVGEDGIQWRQRGLNFEDTCRNPLVLVWRSFALHPKQYRGNK